MRSILTLTGAALFGLGLAASALPAGAQNTKTAIFAGGCFWCVESDFDHVAGVLDTTSGYIGGKAENPTYYDHEGFREAVRITFDPAKVSYDHLLDVYWHSVDPTDSGGQFCDRGHAYTTAIYATDQNQLKKAKASEAAVRKDLGEVATEVQPAPKFWPAEGYHQDYYKKNPVKYKFYRYNCGRNARIQSVWGDKAFMGIKDHMG
ncbi:peptide-methionine (S)-S-oxide reductase MsrA [Aurantimonas sp. VKM B-3413]|uniref:peptide-methionine (S)-S-oxide reductase MsrA n=1 Tax=Aurantimonas sp. VKM B-3413 TaxID=2779401 RepID=UPI001E3BB132|nr:peptide-methionine (S)-S-oxide reductase MsrA [Aurantimonas sp. VKM B-3413]MCB8836742.1 peptide-methionine (S)-S-oxide reductase MsrA [Aurantimonas sp. VKM B-3413]